jgi:hypothetical protein
MRTKSTTPAADVVAVKPAAPGTNSHAERCEDALLKAVIGASAIYDAIRQIATVEPDGKAAADKDAPPLLRLATPDGVAKLMKASSDAINAAIEGFGQIQALREANAENVAGGTDVVPTSESDPLRHVLAAYRNVAEAHSNELEQD